MTPTHVNPFSRLPTTLPGGGANPAAISDLYDKVESNQPTPPNLTAINSEIATLQKQVAELQTEVAKLVNFNVNVTDLTGAPQFAFLPALPTIPSNNPTTGAPYAQDGLEILFTPNPNKPGSFYRYAGAPYYQWSGPELGGIQVDTHANRLTNYAAAAYKLTLFFESDRQVTYESDGTNWVYVSGVMQAAVANQPTDLSTPDTGFLFLATDVPVTLWRWTGSAWTRELLVVLEDTHANRLANYAPANYPVGALFFETDRRVTYLNKVVAAANTWVYCMGVMEAVIASRPTLGTADAGFLFIATDRLTAGLFYWSGSAWVNLPVAGSDTQVQYAKLVAGIVQFAADANLVWDYTNQVLTITAASAIVAGLNVAIGYISADVGFETPGVAANAIQAPSGGVSAKLLTATDSLIFVQEAAPGLSASGQTRLYMDSTSHKVRISQNGGAYVDLVAVTAITQLTGDVTAGPGTGSQAATLAAIQGTPVSAASPTNGDILEFNGTDWVNTPGTQAGLVQHATESSQLTLTNSYQDIPGVTITLSRAGTWVIIGCESFSLITTDGAAFMRLVAGGSAQTPFAPAVSANGSGSAIYATAQSWVYAAALNDVVKLQAKSAASGGVTDANLDGTITAIWIHA